MAAPNRVVIGGVAAVIALATPVVMKWEGISLTPYFDIANVKTVCVGETHGIQNRRYSVDECHAMLRRSMHAHAEPILHCLPESAPLEVKASMVSLGYNIGVTAVCNSTAAKRARAGDYAGACEAIERFNKARVNGKLVVVRGLARRRADERALCEQGLA